MGLIRLIDKLLTLNYKLMQGYYLEIKITKVFHVTLVDPEQKRKLLECIKLDLLSCDCEGVYDRIESNVKHLMDNVLPL